MRRALFLAPRATNRALTSTTRSTISSIHLSRTAPSLNTKRQYHEKVLDHYSNPRNVGSMQKSDMDVGTGLVGAPACGDVMKLQIRVDDKTNTIADVKFKTFGCGSAIASSSYLTELVRGMTLEQASKIRNTEIAKELCLPPVKCEYTLPTSLRQDPDERRWLMIFSALLDAGRRCHQICHFELLHQKPKG